MMRLDRRHRRPGRAVPSAKVRGKPVWQTVVLRLKLLPLEADTPIGHSGARGGSTVVPGRSGCHRSNSAA